MSKKLKVFRLSLKKWLRGSSGASYLRDATNNTYCCLGLFAVQCGIPAKKLSWVGSPASLLHEAFNGDIGRVPEDYRPLTNDGGGNSSATGVAIVTNDNPTTTDAQKVKALRPIFRKWGYRIEVVP